MEKDFHLHAATLRATNIALSSCQDCNSPNLNHDHRSNDFSLDADLVPDIDSNLVPDDVPDTRNTSLN